MSDFDPTKLKIELDTENIGCRDYLTITLSYMIESLSPSGIMEEVEQTICKSRVNLRDLKSRLSDY